jgi:hypothetical protein
MAVVLIVHIINNSGTPSNKKERSLKNDLSVDGYEVSIYSEYSCSFIIAIRPSTKSPCFAPH